MLLEGSVEAVTAVAADEAGNEEQTPHRVRLVSSKGGDAKKEEGFVRLFPKDGTPEGIAGSHCSQARSWWAVEQ